MNCPCCALGEVSGQTDTCNLCGYSMKANVATQSGHDRKDTSAADPARSVVQVASRGMAGSGTAITVTVKDGKGKPLAAGGDRVVVAVTGANRGRPRVTDVGNGTYTATYTPVFAGGDQLAVTLNGVPVRGSPFATTAGPGPADESQTTATVPSGSAGSKTTVAITVRDANGNDLTSGGDTIGVSIAGANTDAKTMVTDGGDSTYTATYTPAISGIDEIHITLNGSPVGGSPFTSSVRAGKASPRRSVAAVPVSGTAGRGTAITITAHDAHRNKLTEGGETASVVVSGANNTRPKVTDVGNGTYVATYTPTVTGTDVIAITLRGKPIAESPFTIVNEAGAANASQTTATVPSGRAGVPVTLVVTVRDAYGNPLPRGGDEVTIRIAGANNMESDVTDHGDGTYSASYTPKNVGTDQITIALNGSSIPGSAFASTVEAGPPDATKTQVTAPHTGVAGRDLRIAVVAHDAHGNRVAQGGGAVALRVEGANAEASADVTDNQDGTYTATYHPTVAGTDTIAVFLNDQLVGGGPVSTTVRAGAPHPAEAVASLRDGRIGQSTHITVTTRDTHGNDLTIGGHELGVTVAGANEGAAVTCRDDGDGTYTASYVPTRAGTDYVAITLDGTTIGDSPCSLSVGPGRPAPEQTIATLPSSSRAGTLTTMTIVAFDAYGNQVGAGGDEVEVALAGANEGAPVTIADQKNGTYIATYTPTVAGVDDIRVTLAGKPVPDSPLAHVVEPGAPDAAQSVASGPVMGKVGVLMTISITTRDRYGNPLTYGGADMSVTVTGANDGARVAVIDNRDGTLFATYTPSLPGKDRISINVGGGPIGSGPIRTSIAVGTASGAHSAADVPAGRVGKPTTVTIRARDVSGNDLSSGGDIATVGVSVANTVTATVQDHGNGTYTATYTPQATGTDYVAIRINGSALGGSPFISQVAAGPTDSHRTAVVAPPSAVAGRPSTLFVRTRDGNGNEIKHGGHPLRVAVSGANDGTSLRVSDNEDGTYTATYTPTKAGTDYITVNIGAEPVGGGEFHSAVLPGPPSVAQTSADLPSMRAGELGSIVIMLRDAYRNPVPGRAGVLRLTLAGANVDANLQLTDNKDGSYTATYTPTIAGTDTVGVAIDGVPIRDSPFRGVVAAGRGSAELSRLAVPAGVAGTPSVMVLSVRDALGNEADRGGDVITVRIEGENAGTHVDVLDRDDGTYALRYTPTAVGRDEIHVAIDGTPIAGMPRVCEVAPGLAVASTAVADLPRGAAGRLVTVHVTARDEWGNNARTSAGTVAAIVTGANEGATVTVNDHNDGHYTITYPPSTAGTDIIGVTLNGEPIQGSPFSCPIEAGPIAAQDCHAVVPPGAVGFTTTISITAKDAYGNPAAGAANQISVAVSGANDGAAVRVAELDKGVYVATYTPTVPGEDELDVTVGGASVVGAPFSTSVALTSEPSGRLPAPAGPVSLQRPALRLTMLCPRCSVAEISEETNQCELCGFSPTAEMPTPTSVVPSASSIQDRAQQELGKRLEVRALISHTARSVVFLAEHKLRNALVALKVIPLQEPLSSESLQDFEQAAAAASRLQHRDLVSILEFGAFPEFLWYTMDHVAGQSLGEIIHQSGPLNFEATVRVIRQTAQAIEYLHSVGVTHRNLKPSNILLDTNTRVHLTDIALPHMHGLSEYMAPEQFEGGPSDPAADQYSLALIMYECLLGKNPVTGGSAEEIAMTGGDGRPLLAAARVDVPSAVQSALDRAMDHDPVQRFASLGEFAAAIAGGIVITTTSTAPTTVPDKAQQPAELPRVLIEEEGRRRKPILWGLAALAVLVATVGFFAITGRWETIPFMSGWNSAAVPTEPPPTEPSRPAQEPGRRGIPGLTTPSATPAATADPATPDTRAPAQPGVLSVTSEPSGLLFVDGKLIGRTPITGARVQPGTRAVRIIQPGFVTFEQTITVEPGATASLGTITLQARPPPNPNQ